jgi:hypothetical protein
MLDFNDLDDNILGSIYRWAYREIDSFNRAHWAYTAMQLINSRIRTYLSINQFNPKASKYPVNQFRGPWIDREGSKDGIHFPLKSLGSSYLFLAGVEYREILTCQRIWQIDSRIPQRGLWVAKKAEMENGTGGRNRSAIGTLDTGILPRRCFKRRGWSFGGFYD